MKEYLNKENYHVCEVLKHLTKETYLCIAGGMISGDWYEEQNLEIILSIGAILNRILVINQIMINLIGRKADIKKGINVYIKENYNFDIDEVWKQTDEMLEQSNTDINSLVIKNRKAYINELLTMKPSELTTLSNYYVDIYNLLEHSNPSTLDINSMMELSLNGLYLGRIMEGEIDRLYKGAFKIDREFLMFLVNKRRPKFFRSVIKACRERGKQAEKVLVY